MFSLFAQSVSDVAAQVNQVRSLLDFKTMILLGVVLVLLGIAYATAQYLQRLPESTVNKAVVQSFNIRISGWWMMYAIMGASLLLGSHRWPSVLFFFLISFWALREFITLTPTRLGDHRALFWVFFVFAPLQYVLVLLGHRSHTVFGITFDAGQLFAILIPVYAFLFVPARIAFAGDHKRFLERTAKIQAGLFFCVYALSHAPALLDLKFKHYDGSAWTGGSAGMMVFLIVIVQMNDVFQYLWSHLLGRHVIAPGISAKKTWEGYIGGVLTAMLVGMAIWFVTPFTPIQAATMAMVVAVMGFAGSLTMSAIKRDRGVQDYGTLVAGHVGVLDRFDSICFAAPVFYHLARFFFT
jgi:phosphatidate cytidylyltransferase